MYVSSDGVFVSDEVVIEGGRLGPIAFSLASRRIPVV
jgi:hypothetical protein